MTVNAKVLSAAGALALVAGLLPAQRLSAAAAVEFGDPRTPINAANTPGDADSRFRIAEPGSYYLPQHLSGQAGKRGIEIAASGVTIDLMGFSVSGVPGSLEGIAVKGVKTRRAITVKNGYVHGWGGDGVDLAIAKTVRVQGVTTWENGGIGIEVGQSATVLDCAADANGEHGFFGAEGVRFADCVAVGNGQDGIRAEEGGSIEGCVSADNTQYGITAAHGAAHNCLAHGNGSGGLLAGVIRGSVARQNDGNGLDSRGVVTESLTRQNGGNGIRASGIAANNASSFNDESGVISYVHGALVRENWLMSNDFRAMHIENGSLAEGNLMRWNQYGLRADYECVVRDNVSTETVTDYTFVGDPLRGPLQTFAGGPLLDTHPGVNVRD